LRRPTATPIDLAQLLNGQFAKFARTLKFYLSKSAVAKLNWITEEWSEQGAAQGAATMALMMNKVRTGVLRNFEFRSHGEHGAASVEFYYPDRSFVVGEPDDPLTLSDQLLFMQLLELHPQTIMSIQPMNLVRATQAVRDRIYQDFTLQIVVCHRYFECFSLQRPSPAEGRRATFPETCS
jgi:hypothetical protein